MLRWSDDVEDKLKELLADTPRPYRKYLDGRVEAVAALQAEKLGRSEIDEDAMIRAYITCVPRHLRDGLPEILGEHNVDLEYYRAVFDEPPPLNHINNQTE